MKLENCCCQEIEKPVEGEFRQKFSKSLTFLIISFVPIILFFGIVIALQYQEQRNLRAEVQSN